MLRKRKTATPAAKALSVSAVEAALAGEQAPTEFRIFRGGENTSTKGTFIFDDKAADSVMAFFAKRGLTPKMDYEHQSLNAAANGQPAPNSAYAWTPQVRRGADGEPELWATAVKWTDRARQMIEAREYSYFSPVFMTDDDNRVTEVWNVALTNLPALDNIDELMAATLIAAATADGKDRPMRKMKCAKCLKALRAPTDDDDGDEVACTVCLNGAKAAKALTALSVAVGLRPDAEEAVALGAVQELVASRDELKKLTGADSIQAALGVIQAWKQSHGEVVALRADVEATKQTARNKEFVALLDQGVTEKKMTAAFRADYWEKHHAPGGNASEAGLVQLRAFVGAAPQIVATPVRQPQTGLGPIPKTQLDMAGNMGLTGDRLKRFEEDRKARMAAGE